LKIAAGSVDDGGEKKGKLMAAEGKPVGRKKRGRRTTGHDALTTIRLSSELRESVDAWAAKQSDKPARPEAILRLVELGLETTHRRESLTNRAAKASQMAAQEIDRLSDPSTTDEERQLRKRRLIKDRKSSEISASNRVRINSQSQCLAGQPANLILRIVLLMLSCGVQQLSST